MIEQPFGTDEFLEHSRLQAKIETPLCLDESVKDVHSAVIASSLKKLQSDLYKAGKSRGDCKISGTEGLLHKEWFESMVWWNA